MDMPLKTFDRRLEEVLRSKGVSEKKIIDVLDSGYTLRKFLTSYKGGISEKISDKMYGNKGFSSCFEIDEFIEYIYGRYNFPELPTFSEYTVNNIDEINEILHDERRQRYMKNGILSFRGQTSQYSYKRKIPNPVRADETGRELSVFPGLYRQSGDFYTFSDIPEEKRTLINFLRELEPSNPRVHLDSTYAYDIMRTEQHYATQTSGLDISFDIETAIFFATYKFKLNQSNKAAYEKIKKGDHEGVIYGFCFREPSVKSTEFLISEFDLFKTYKPERVLRQNCGLPLFGQHERNIAITDLDFIIKLHRNFDYEGLRTPEYMFPNTQEDPFYGKLLELKDRHPDLLSNIVEYDGSRVNFPA
jgi:hypothetical protein